MNGGTRLGRWLFVGFAALYGLTLHGRPFSDGRLHLEQVETFVVTGAFTMAPERADEPLTSITFMRPGRDGRVYLTLPPGLALAASPLGLLGRLFGRVTGRIPDPHPPRADLPDPTIALWASFTMPLAVAGMIWAFFRIVLEISDSRARALEGALVLGLATNTWFYATTFWTRPLAAACLVAALLAILVARDRVPVWLLAGSLVGLATVARYEIVLAAPWLVGLTVARADRRGRALVALALPICLASLALAGWNDFRFGDPFDTGSRHQTLRDFDARVVWQALERLLFGANEGLFRYVPVLLLGVLALPRALRSQRALVTTTLGVVATLLCFYAIFTWSRSVPPIAWGSRHLFPVVPFLLLPAFLSRDTDPLAPIWARLLVAGSVVLQIGGVAQRSRLATPLWWLHDPTPAGFAVALGLAALVVLAAWRGALASARGPGGIPQSASRQAPGDASDQST